MIICSSSFVGVCVCVLDIIIEASSYVFFFPYFVLTQDDDSSAHNTFPQLLR